jgi:inosose dehydratase
MQGDAWTGDVRDIIQAAADGGLDGVELTQNVLRRGPQDPVALRAALNGCDLQLACLRYSMRTGFTRPGEAPAEIAGARTAIEFARAAGTRRLGLKGPADPEPDRERRAKIAHAAAMCNEIATMASQAGLTINVHLHSHADAVIRTPEEWDLFLEQTDPGSVYICADAGHLLRLGHNPAETVRRHIDRVSHVHLKDASRDGSFPPLGRGMLDVTAFIHALLDGGYAGWVVLEEEHESQVADPAGALRKAAQSVRQSGWR